jgi:type IV pilus assembly protein PilM
LKFNFFKEKTPPLIGIDISSTSIKMVELSDDGRGGYKLEGYSSAPLAKDAMVDGNVGDLEKVADAIKQAWKLLGSREKRVALALPASSVISKKVLMAADLREEDMEAQVEAEANQYIPFSLDEVNIDFQVLGAAPNNPDEVEVLIAASRKEKIEDRVAAAEGAGLKVTVMDVENYATEAAYSLVSSQLPNAGREQTVIIIDIGASMMHINVLHDNKSVYTREQSFGGGQLTQEIQRRFGLSLEEAEIAKRKGGLPESYDSEVLQPFMQTLAMEVARALQFFTSSTQYNRIDHIVLAGGCAAIPTIDVVVQDRTQVHTIVANPFHSMTISTRLKQQQAATDAPALLIACGLAMRGVTV